MLSAELWAKTSCRGMVQNLIKDFNKIKSSADIHIGIVACKWFVYMVKIRFCFMPSPSTSPKIFGAGQTFLTRPKIELHSRFGPAKIVLGHVEGRVIKPYLSNQWSFVQSLVGGFF